MPENFENLIQEITNSLKANEDVSIYKKNRQLSSFVTLLTHLNSLPHAQVPQPDLMRVKNQILDRITLPQTEQKPKWFSLAGSLPHMLRVGSGIMGGLLIVISLTLGAAVAALNSVPGQTIYPLKKIAESIQLKLTPDADKTNLQFKFANNRVDELQQVIQQQQDGQISAKQAQKIVADTVSDLQTSTRAAAKSTASQPKAAVVTKLADLSSKLRIASIHSEGEVKVELEKALQNTRVSKEEAIKNIQQAGIKVEGQPVEIDDAVSASGKLTGASDTTVSIGSAKFLITKDTTYINTTAKDLQIGQLVDISGEIKDNKSYANRITLIIDPKVKGAETTKTDNSETNPQTDTPIAP